MGSDDIVLLEEGDPNSGFRTQNLPGDKARSVLIDEGKALILKATLVSVTHGSYTEDGDPATLLVFEFTFISVERARRFSSATITLTFDDASENLRNRPEVVAISPSGQFAINKTTSSRDLKQSVNAGLNGTVLGVGGEVGYTWETSKVEEKSHATTLIGLKRVVGGWGKDNRVIFKLDEDEITKEGIPSFLRTAVLLKRRDDVPFRFTIEVDTGVDFGSKIRRLFGRKNPDAIDPVELDDETDLEELGITTLDPNKVDLDNMRDLNIKEQADVIIATLIQVPA
ncbi:hypothetical protein PFICI_08748 [Pestalotiopsis fici W106-1]|uniref:Uncharacterized protein n=1 Tax=Pestalotiopsis fici (strain W106-1 / CGMCC3.15140) TaxID=1229662 RepID=W3WYH1_PESFW|nr:uncharacterized protein PFICI_08748 [Pestalotiopsis fici W106-1]ETS78895.1 hypothetical protein PFICI_08748 [Pestalotiopsis fici W106-1]